MTKNCTCPKCQGPSEPIPPEGLIDISTNKDGSCVVVWNADGTIAMAVHPDQWFAMMDKE